ncbi:MAG: RagB/SusD family nutrient uptake outer membrane protein [Prevotellaceae bacterium]|nr:RagB/SusD family nutrient uptake outer membrane protein [Prevotellaceae bacterium]MDY5210539.1 RagB/SusD family nutrient uptake outer membrane protein [Prevotella sp.]
MKKYILSALAVCSAAIFTSCDDMLDTDPRVTDATSATFPGKIADVEALNTATYSIMNTMGGGDPDNQNPFLWWEVMSDNCFGSGGLQDNKVKSLHHLVQMNSNQYEQAFVLLYGGINRANNQIETIDNVDWTGNEAKRNQLLGEGYFMRGLYTLWLTQLYGDVPLITSTLITEEMKAQVSAEEVIYPQILSDFVSGQNLMSTEKSSGHANKYVAEAFMARAYMFWAGFYKKVADLSGSAPDINLVKQEGCTAASLSKDNVVSALRDIVSSGAYELLEDYRSLWQYSNSYVWDETQKAIETGEGHAYKFIADMKREHCFDQPGMGNGNKEELFQIQFMNASKWDLDQKGPYSCARMYCNYLSVFWALRVNGHNGDRNFTYPFTQGWGQGTPSNNIWDDWTIAEKEGGYTDIRKLGSLIDGVTENKEIDYEFVKDCCEASGFGVKKYNGVTLDALTGDSPWWDFAGGENFKGTLDNPMQGDHFEDFYLMRYADVLLMLSEMTGDAQYMNQVQKRAGVPETPYSLKELQNQRRWEFAFEGLRFNDMRRWSGKDGGESCYAAKALQAQAGKQMVVKGNVANKTTMKHMTCSWTKRYADTNGFLAKPQSQITLMNGKLIQNPGWDENTPEAEKQYVDLYN